MEANNETESLRAEIARQELIDAVIKSLRLDPDNPAGGGTADYKRRFNPDDEYVWLELIKGKSDAGDDEEVDHIVELITVHRKPGEYSIETLALIDLKTRQVTDETGQALDFDCATSYRVTVQTLLV